MRVNKAIQNMLQNAKTGRDEGCCKIERREGRYNLPDNYRSQAFICEHLRNTIRLLITGRKPWPLFLHGEAGSGKTCAALCMFDWWGGRYADYQDMCANLRLAMKGEAYSSGGYRIFEADIWRPWTKSNLTVLDDFGARQPTDFQYDVLKKAIDTRHQKPAVFISNLNLEQIDALYDDRVASRLSAGTIVELKGDRRGEKVP